MEQYAAIDSRNRANTRALVDRHEIPDHNQILLLSHLFIYYPFGIYLYKVNNRNMRLSYEMCLKLTIKAPGQRLNTCMTSLLFSIVSLFGWLKDITKKVGTF